MNFAERLVFSRKEKEITQAALAEKLGVSVSTVSQWEHGKTSPDPEMLTKIAAVLDMTVDNLLGVENQTVPEEETKSQGEKVPEKDAVSFKNGIHIHSKDGDRVDIDLHGVHVDSKKDNTKVDVSGAGVTVTENGVIKKKPDVSRAQKFFNTFPYPILATMIYLVGGFCNMFGGWHPGWVVFLTIPLYYSLVNAVFSHRLSHFAYPVLVTALYLIGGFCNILGGWHPGWIMFLTIPIFYWIVELFTGKNKKDE